MNHLHKGGFFVSTNHVVVIRRSLKLLTNDFDLALVLGQLIYWCTRTRDASQYIQEERLNFDNSSSDQFGWIQKSARELDEELMTDRSDSTIRGYLKRLSRWVQERRIKGVHQCEYRVMLHLVIKDLHELGQAADEFLEILGMKQMDKSSVIQSSEIENQSSENEDLCLKNNLKNTVKLKDRNEMSDSAKHTNTYSIPETLGNTIHEQLSQRMWFSPHDEYWTSGSIYAAPIAAMLWKTYKNLVSEDTITLMFESFDAMCAEYMNQGYKMKVKSPIGLFRECFELGLSWYAVLKNVKREDWTLRLHALRTQMWSDRNHSKKYRNIS